MPESKGYDVSEKRLRCKKVIIMVTCTVSSSLPFLVLSSAMELFNLSTYFDIISYVFIRPWVKISFAHCSGISEVFPCIKQYVYGVGDLRYWC